MVKASELDIDENASDLVIAQDDLGPIQIRAGTFGLPIIDEICAIFPVLDPYSGQDYGTSARQTLRKFKAQLLLQKTRAA